VPGLTVQMCGSDRRPRPESSPGRNRVEVRRSMLPTGAKEKARQDPDGHTVRSTGLRADRGRLSGKLLQAAARPWITRS